MAKKPSQFPSLSDASNMINAESDHLATLITQIEQTLAKYNLGVEAWIPIESETGDGGETYATELGYAKIEKRWALYLRRSMDQTDSERIAILRDSSRDDRVSASQHLPDLIQTLVKAAQDKATQIAAATSRAEEALRTLSEGAPSDPPEAVVPDEEDIPF